VDVNKIPDGWQVLMQDQNQPTLKKVIMESKTITLERSFRCIEMENFANGTIALGNYIAASTENGAFSLVGEIQLQQ
jgi:phosphoglycerate kinase